MAPRAGNLAVAVALAAIPGAAGCSSSSALPSSSSPTAAPLTAVVDQFRDDYASGTIVLQLDDRTAGPITVVRAELADSRFEPGTVWTGSIDLSPDQPISLPAVISPPRCEATSAGPTVAATLSDGRVITVSATDPHAVLPRLITEKCFAASVARSADLRLSDDLTPGLSPQTAVLELIVVPPSQPAPSPDSVGLSLASVGGTTLLEQDPSQPWPRNLKLVPAEPAIPIAVRPARCDPHAVAEDKVGTLIPLTLNTGGQTGVVKIPASDHLKAEIYAFVARACGWQGAR